ncbi:MAG TPA: hypothetical protein VEV37_08320, partial [Bryobacteraceae bacterium]|nr:hypothetical protein [Bryobacteraceae bacterium]
HNRQANIPSWEQIQMSGCVPKQPREVFETANQESVTKLTLLYSMVNYYDIVSSSESRGRAV